VKGSVLAVEADIWLASLLSASKKFEENKTFAISILPCAISDCNGIAKFSIAKRGRASNHLESVEGRGTAGGSREVVCVPTLTLSKLLDFFDPPTFLKIDVEGAEKMVLAGGEKVFSDARPVTFIEVGTENNAFVTSFFKNMDYLLFDGNTDLEFQKPSSECFGDTLAFPKEQYDLVLAKKGK
jgi:FkbM family methyltransferase